MAKHRRRARRRHRRGMGSIIVARKMSGLGRIGKPNTWMGTVLPPVVGAGITGLTILGIKYFADPSRSSTEKFLSDWSPWVGLGAGALGSAALYFLGGMPAAVSGFTAGAMVTGTVATKEYLEKQGAIPTAPAAAAAGTAGFGAIVPEYSRALPARGMGAIVLENQASRGYGAGSLGSYGEEVNLGNVTPGAFGTPGFSI